MNSVANFQKIDFKPSPLGPIPLDWEIKKLGTLAIKIGSGITPTGGAQVYKKEGRPFLRSQNVGWGNLLLDDVVFIDEKMHETFSSTEIKENDVLLNITGASIGRSALADKRIINGNVNQHVCIIRPKAQELTPQFLSSFLLSTIGQNLIDSFQAGGNREGLNFEQIKSFPIPLPPVNEQRTISGLLNTWDKAIEKTTQLITAKEQRKKWLMQQLLTGKKRLKGFKDDWKESHFDDCFDIIKSYSISRDGLSHDLNDSSVYCVHYGDIHALYEGEFLDFSKQTGIPQITGTEQIINDRDYLINGDLILADASEDYEGVGETIEVTNLDHKIAVGGLHTIVIRAKQNGVTVGFRAYLFASESVRNELRKKATGTSVYSVTKSTLQTLIFKLPSSDEQTAISNILQTADKEITLLKQKLEAYKEQKKGLMQVLLTGKKRLKI